MEKMDVPENNLPDSMGLSPVISKEGSADRMSNPEKFPTWKIIKIGTGLKTPDDFYKALDKVGCQVEDSARKIISHPNFVVSDKETEVELVLVSSEDLGYSKEVGHIGGIYKTAMRAGLELCPLEVAPQILLQHTGRPSQFTGKSLENLIVATEVITYSERASSLGFDSNVPAGVGPNQLQIRWYPNGTSLSVNSGSGKWNQNIHAEDFSYYLPSQLWVFMRGRH